MFPAGMLGTSRKLKRYGVQKKGGGAGGGGMDSNGPGGNGSGGQELRYDIMAYQFDVLHIVMGGGGVAGYMHPFNVSSSPIGGPGGGYRPGGLAGGGNSSGSGGHGGGSTGAYLQGKPLGAAGGGGGGGGGSLNQSGGSSGENGVNPASMPTDGTGQDGESATDDGGGGGGGGGGFDPSHLGGQGGAKGRDNSSRSGGGRAAGSYADPALTLPFTGTVLDLSAYGKGGRGGNGSTSYGFRVGDGESGTTGVAVVTDYETGQHYWVTSSQGVTLP